jgi:phosphatidylglycerol---prolipoprotein diacylglyceryl transferase
MIPFAIAFPDIHPVAFAIGPLTVKWYGLAYMAGLLLGWAYVRRLLSQDQLWAPGKAPFGLDKTDDMLLMMTVGVIVGGRLGEVLFYNLGYFLAHPWEIPAVWHGGMSFHGGFIGSVLALGFFARRSGVTMLSVFDLAAAAVPIGLFFGRVANFINAELWGRPSNVAWSMVFPGAGPITRHPSQLYEAATEGLLLLVVCWFLIYHRDALKRPGLIAGVFTAGYGLARSFCELFREPEVGHWLNVGPITAGILYSVPMILAGLWLIQRARTQAITA